MKTILFIIVIIFGCTQTDAIETGLELSQEDISASLEKSAATLDRMIITTEKMSADLEIIIQNEDAIFKAVTNCISNETCEALKNEMSKVGKAP
tara:strand:- start:150 stop:431 length:282 start_codon:yes stop_codon:yes gene_type:complete